MIDLHTHTTASDGTLSPAELVRYAAQKRLEAVAVTDHDTVEGVAEALSAGTVTGIEVVPGIEISARYPGATLHILGYYPDISDPGFLKSIRLLQQARAERNPEIIRRLQKLGIDITLDEVTRKAETGQTGRPHFAQVLLEKGYVKTIREAFDKYLKKGAAAYVDKFRFPPQEAIAHIRNAGGIPVLAHPQTLKCPSATVLELFLTDMVSYGLMGIEAHYPDHTPADTAQYERLAEKYGLLVTGGTDFHGKALSGIDIGSGRGSMQVDYGLLEKLKSAAASPAV